MRDGLLTKILLEYTYLIGISSVITVFTVSINIYRYDKVIIFEPNRALLSLEIFLVTLGLISIFYFGYNRLLHDLVTGEVGE